MKRVHRGRSATAALVLLALAGCGSSDEVAVTGEGADAQGEIAGGTISDAMIPVEELRSSSPPVGGDDGDRGGDGAAPSGETGSPASGEEAEDAPAAGEEDGEAGEGAGD